MGSFFGIPTISPTEVTRNVQEPPPDMSPVPSWEEQFLAVAQCALQAVQKEANALKQAKIERLLSEGVERSVAERKGECAAAEVKEDIAEEAAYEEIDRTCTNLFNKLFSASNDYFRPIRPYKIDAIISVMIKAGISEGDKKVCGFVFAALKKFDSINMLLSDLSGRVGSSDPKFLPIAACISSFFSEQDMRWMAKNKAIHLKHQDFDDDFRKDIDTGLKRRLSHV